MRAKYCSRPDRQPLSGCLLALLLSASAGAQEIEPPPDADTLETEIEEVRRYTVELIIFEYADTVSAGSEIFLPDESPVEELAEDIPVFGDPGTVLPEDFLLPEPDPEDIALEEIVSPVQVELLLQDPDDFSMSGIYDRLVKLDAYQPVMRAGWTQVTVDKDLSPAIRLRMLGIPPLRLDGSLTLYLSRYLHLVVDLTLDAASSQTGAQSTGETITFGDSRAPYEFENFEEIPAALPVHYRLFEDRIVKSGDLRYFDHPKFGLLAKITRYEGPEEEEPDANQADPNALLSADK